MDKSVVSSLVFCLFGLVGTAWGEMYGIQWTYGDNPTGPENWPIMFPYKCAWQEQSPVDIRTMQTVYDENLDPFVLLYDTPTTRSRFFVENTGHYIQVDTVGDFYVIGGGLGSVHTTQQFHFHWGDDIDIGSEHTVNGEKFPMELHIVNWNLQKYKTYAEAANYTDGISVLGILFELSLYDNPVLEPIVQAIQDVLYPDHTRKVEIPAFSLKRFLPKDPHRYFRYYGSLTTPPCSENVLWTVFENRLPISERQLNAFHQAFMLGGANNGVPSISSGPKEPMVNNYRPIQPLNERTVYRSFPY